MNLRNILIAASLSGAALCGSLYCDAQRVVLLHTNDTHSQIDPNDKNLGGVLRRKALVDSVRAAEPNVLLIDAGDAVQGTLYFTLFGGEVENMVMNDMGYDIQILGNHEFDNGVDALARQWRDVKATRLATNYDFTSTPLDSLFVPYVIKNFGGKKIGFLAVNIDPKGMIADKNSRGVVYLDGLKAANSTAWHLKHNEKCDMVVAITHVGYDNEPGYSDTDLASKSEDIDIIIGGHSHTTINPVDDNSPAWRVVNAAGDTVIVAQTGKGGGYLGEITLDLDKDKSGYRLIKVDSRLDNRLDDSLAARLAPYKQAVDSVKAIKIGVATKDYAAGKPGILNWMADFVKRDAARLTDKKIDMSIVNKGGIRGGISKGAITKGQIMQIFPLDNRTVVIEISGRDLLDNFDVMAAQGGNGVSAGVEAVFDKATGKCRSVTIDGKSVDPEKIYRVATIDYLSNGGDYMQPLTRGEKIAESSGVLYDDMIDAFVKGFLKNKKQTPDNTVRMRAD